MYRVGQKSCYPLVKLIQYIIYGKFDLKNLILKCLVIAIGGKRCGRHDDRGIVIVVNGLIWF